MTRPPTVFIVDDDESVLGGLSRLVRSIGMNAETFASASEFLGRGPAEGNCCIVLDLYMPGMGGMQLQDELSRMDYSPPIIFLTAHGDVPASVRTMKNGAVDFLQKPVEERDLLRAIEDALAKDRRLRSEQTVVREIRARLDTLTPRELEVLRYVIGGALNKQIAFELGIAEKTVKIHRGRMTKKMQVEIGSRSRPGVRAAGDPCQNRVTVSSRAREAGCSSRAKGQNSTSPPAGRSDYLFTKSVTLIEQPLSPSR